MQNVLSVGAALEIHHLTSPLFFIAYSVIVCATLLFFRYRHEAVLFGVTFIVTTALVVALKHIFAIPRPESALVQLTDYAFPSNHAALSAVFAVVLGWFFKYRAHCARWVSFLAVAAFVVLAVLVDISRLVLEVHTLVQVVAGTLIGSTISVIAIYVLGLKERMR